MRMEMPLRNGVQPMPAVSGSRPDSGPRASIGGQKALLGSSRGSRRMRKAVARATSLPLASRRAAMSWIFLPSRNTSVSSVSGATGTGRIRSTVRRATRIGTGEGSCSTAQQISEEGAAPCCSLGSHGPPAKALVSTFAPSTR